MMLLPQHTALSGEMDLDAFAAYFNLPPALADKLFKVLDR